VDGSSGHDPRRKAGDGCTRAHALRLAGFVFIVADREGTALSSRLRTSKPARMLTGSEPASVHF
jgi:hypothetical protein